MRESEDWIDIDGKDSNGYPASYDGSDIRSESSDYSEYNHIPKSKEQIQEERIREFENDISQKRKSLERCKQYSGEAFKEYQRYEDAISRLNKEINDITSWIGELRNEQPN
jgi:chromosome segregation ATPase